ncbi:hypothetical protein F4825DRAFT_432633 [Nemania diffusa]|nr:hypothetical protein F4825DRAFT_432633 [Nemania diffusa]
MDEPIAAQRRSPTFASFPILRTVLFLAGFDLETALDPYRRGVAIVNTTRARFHDICIGISPDTSSTRGIISSSFMELVIGSCIVGVVAYLVSIFHAHPQGESYQPGLGLGLEIEAPILAAFFTLFALITAMYTSLAISETPDSNLMKFLNETFPPLERCAICQEEGENEPIINLQCFSDAEEAANPQRALHWFHENCIAAWWLENGHRAGICPLCSKESVAFRSPAGPRHSSPSAIAWATHCFFRCILLFFGHFDSHISGARPRRPFVHATPYAFALTRGVLVLCLLLLSRLVFARILYVCYLAFPRLLQIYVYGGVREYLCRLWLLDLYPVSRWPIRDYLCPELPGSLPIDPPSRGEGWRLGITAAVISFIIIHGCALRIADAFYSRFSPRRFHSLIGKRTRDSSILLFNFAARIIQCWRNFRGNILLFAGVDSYLFLQLSLLALTHAFLASKEIAFTETERWPDWIIFLVIVIEATWRFLIATAFYVFAYAYFVPFVLLVLSVFLLPLLLTIWDEIFWPVLGIISAYSFAKGFVPALGSWFTSDIQLPIPYFAPATVTVPRLELGEGVEWALVIICSLPAILRMLRFAWCNSPSRVNAPPHDI